MCFRSFEDFFVFPYFSLSEVYCTSNLVLPLQKYVVQNPAVGRRMRRLKERAFPRKREKFVEIEREMDVSPDWPPVSKSSMSLAELVKYEFAPAHEDLNRTTERVRTISGLTNASMDEDEGRNLIIHPDGHPERRLHPDDPSRMLIGGDVLQMENEAFYSEPTTIVHSDVRDQSTRL